MRERLKKLIGPGYTDQLKMGTFHALCARFLRIHSTLVGLDGNFTICDADESKKLIGSILKDHQNTLEEKAIVLTESAVQSMISKAKAKGETAHEFSRRAERALHLGRNHTSNSGDPLVSVETVVGLIYEEYERTLRRNNSLDFDDLLLYGVKLFCGYKQTVAWCKYVLVDEFQDTNTTQYSLMVGLAIHKRVTVVGDPDQSIYGWRSAEVENLAKMIRDFTGTKQIFLEQNYRSSAAILKVSLAIVSQDKNRIPKSLHTSHPSGSTPFLRSFPTEHAEALFIAIEIKRLIAHMGGALSWGDVAILLRFNALSRVIESSLQKHGIPSRVLGGHKFFERAELTVVLKGTSPADLIRQLVELVGFEDHLKKTQPDWESRWENVKELITFATEVTANVGLIGEKSDNDVPPDTPLRSFLQASMLSSEGDNQSEEESKDVIEKGTFPFARSDDEEEERFVQRTSAKAQLRLTPKFRRLLYVACTRAQGLLYLTCSETRNVAGKKGERVVSPFITIVQWDNPTFFTDLQPTFLPPDQEVICKIVNRNAPSESDVLSRVAEFEKTTPYHLMDDFGRPQDAFSSFTGHGSVEVDRTNLATNFTSVLQASRTPSLTITTVQQSKPNWLQNPYSQIAQRIPQCGPGITPSTPPSNNVFQTAAYQAMAAPLSRQTLAKIQLSSSTSRSAFQRSPVNTNDTMSKDYNWVFQQKI
ncbi:hypothetical protein H0H93_000976 [Arthromyces matolae]|nr:hypothetical protein H0H93_000976 [Arthromyces matolae]